MGNSQPCRSNETMIDSLVKRNRVLVRNVERAFRLVDRAMFLPENQSGRAYADLPIKVQDVEGGKFFPGPLHVSSADVYVSVVRQLEIEKGQSFLNIGSGTGYLNTIVGLLLGENGINHGMEFYPNLIEYAEECIDEWVKTPGAHCIGWTRPLFSVGDIFNEQFSMENIKKYDRIYISFIHPPDVSLMSRMLRMLKIGGVMIAPNEDHLCRFVRIDENTCEREDISRMSFSMPVRQSPEEPQLPVASFEKVPSLCFLARRQILSETRKAVFTRDVMKTVSKTIRVKVGGRNIPRFARIEAINGPPRHPHGNFNYRPSRHRRYLNVDIPVDTETDDELMNELPRSRHVRNVAERQRNEEDEGDSLSFDDQEYVPFSIEVSEQSSAGSSNPPPPPPESPPESPGPSEVPPRQTIAESMNEYMRHLETTAMRLQQQSQEIHREFLNSAINLPLHESFRPIEFNARPIRSNRTLRGGRPRELQQNQLNHQRLTQSVMEANFQTLRNDMLALRTRIRADQMNVPLNDLRVRRLASPVLPTNNINENGNEAVHLPHRRRPVQAVPPVLNDPLHMNIRVINGRELNSERVNGDLTGDEDEDDDWEEMLKHLKEKKDFGDYSDDGLITDDGPISSDYDETLSNVSDDEEGPSTSTKIFSRRRIIQTRQISITRRVIRKKLKMALRQTDPNQEERKHKYAVKIRDIYIQRADLEFHELIQSIPIPQKLRDYIQSFSQKVE